MTGWPWPLDGVQGFFEGIVNTISRALAPVIQAVTDTLKPIVDGIASAVADVSTAVWNALPTWIQDALLFLGELAGQAWEGLWDFISDPVGSIQAGLDWVTTTIGATLTTMSTAIGDVAAGVWTALPDWVRRPLEFLKDLAGKAWDGLWGFVKDPVGSIQAGLDWVLDSTKTMFDGAVAGITSLVGDVLKGVTGALGTALQGFLKWFGDQLGWLAGVIVGAVQAITQTVGAFFTDLMRGFITTITAVFSPGSPDEIDVSISETMVATVISQLEEISTVPRKSPIAYEALLPAVVSTVGRFFVLKTAVESLGAAADAAHPMKELKAHRIAAGLMGMLDMPGVIGPLLGAPVKHGLLTPWDQAMAARYRPAIPAIAEAQRMLWRGKINVDQFRDVLARSGVGEPFEDGYVELTHQLPGPGDLIRFVVREVIAPDVFATYMAYQGFSEMISGWFWEAHWVLPGRGDLVDAFHRKVITSDELNKFIVWHDYSPTARPGIAKSDVAIMRGIQKTLIPRVDLRYGWEMGHLSDEDLDERYELLGYEDDAWLMADIQKVRALTEEIHKVRDEWIRDFLEGYILEDVLRANLAAIGIGPARINYYVAYAKMRREREYMKDLLDLYEDSYVKGLPTEPPFETFIRQEIVDKEMAELFIRRAYLRAYKKPKEVKPPEAKRLPLSDLRRAFRQEMISEEDFRAELAERDYAAADIDVIVAIEKEKMAA